MHKIYLIAPGPRPFFGDVARHLRGPGRDFDSAVTTIRLPDGGWTELTMTLRADEVRRVDIDSLE